jgi:DNA-directed RNA polymerase subunit M/transcription elongation factor TFIIS
MSWNKFCTINDDYNNCLLKFDCLYFKLQQECQKNSAILQKPKASYATCHKCKSNKIWIDDRQVRSGDEGSTAFFKCSECNHEWRQQ